ncbi:MAG TPA: DNA-binding protein [Clostridiales bacterium]|nr:DNA-binding protein [Clostridiales bacterium]
MQAEVEWWLKAGERDLEAALALRKSGLFDSAAFHCQQAAEKTLKALVLAVARTVPRTHASVFLIKMLEEARCRVPEAVATACRKLDPHYMNARYPNGVGGAPEEFYDERITSEAIENAETVRAFVLERLHEGQ